MENTKLTSREKEVIICLAQGMTNHEIADTLYVSFETIKSHRKNILRKLKAKSSFHLAVKILRQGLLPQNFGTPSPSMV